MKIVRLEPYEETIKKQGQEIHKYALKNLLTLRKGVFKKGGVFCWKEHVDKLGKPGIGLNPAIARMDLSRLLILDKKEGRFYQISNLDKAERYKGRKSLSGSSYVLVYPLSCFEEVVVEDKHHIEDSPVPISRLDIQSRQVKLGEVKT